MTSIIVLFSAIMMPKVGLGEEITDKPINERLRGGLLLRSGEGILIFDLAVIQSQCFLRLKELSVR